jgi:uncharacterized protein (DUF58 family)
MLVPTPRLLWLAALVAAAGALVSVYPVALPVWGVGVAVIALAALADAVAVLRLPVPEAKRIVPGSLPLGVQHDVVLRIANRHDGPLDVEVYDRHPPQVEAEGLPRRVALPARGWAEVRYGLRPVERGELAFGRVAVRIAAPLGLWARPAETGEAQSVRVYPNFAALTRFALLAIDNRLAQIGVLQRRRRGEGLDFHQLREYREGDMERQIDWKATSRAGKLISREYQDERDQTILLLVDCGRRMSAQDGPLSHFDHVLNAALLLAYVALRQGDAVGLLTVGGPARWLAPRKSGATVNLLMNRVYDLQPSLATTDYYGAALEVMKRMRKRALVVVLSNMRDEDDDTLAPALRLLQSRHLVLFASLREAILGRALDSRVDTFDRAVTHAATADYLARREIAFRRIERGGAVAVDVEPEALPIALVNRYLDIKRAGRL